MQPENEKLRLTREWLTKAEHNLVELVRQCEQVDVAFSGLLEAGELLMEYFTTSRYPSNVELPTDDEAAEALRLAREAVHFIATRLPSPDA